MTPLRWFRLIFYPVALGAAALLLGLPGGGEDAGAVLYGETAQRAPLRMSLDARGRPLDFETTLDARCTGDQTWFFRWKAYDGIQGDFEFRDGRLEVVNRGEETYSDGRHGRWVLSMSAEVDDARAVEGTAALVERFRLPGGGRYTCESGPVRFTARR